ncbi:MAG: metal ABC transporter ATP-binding protein [Alphaproteobacteria bacterium]|nr:metal ABC transporter ATP-binding protein [Alphaproteobacteria bacterium]
MSHSPLIQLKGVSYIKNSKPLLTDISFEVRKNEIITIVGKNGAGKTTLCKTLIGIIKPTAGKIIKQAGLKISYIPQISNHNVLVPICVKDFIILNNKKKLENDDFQLIQQLNLEDSLNKLFKDLSGGEKQKVMLLRALLLCPDIIVLDEPTSNIDFSAKDDMYSLINEYRGAKNFSVIMVSHDLHMVLKNTGWVLCLKDGKICCSGIPSVVNESEILKNISLNYKYYNHKD